MTRARPRRGLTNDETLVVVFGCTAPVTAPLVAPVAATAPVITPRSEAPAGLCAQPTAG